MSGIPSFKVIERDGKYFVQIPKGGLP